MTWLQGGTISPGTRKIDLVVYSQELKPLRKIAVLATVKSLSDSEVQKRKIIQLPTQNTRSPFPIPLSCPIIFPGSHNQRTLPQRTSRTCSVYTSTQHTARSICQSSHPIWVSTELILSISSGSDIPGFGLHSYIQPRQGTWKRHARSCRSWWLASGDRSDHCSQEIDRLALEGPMLGQLGPGLE